MKKCLSVFVFLLIIVALIILDIYFIEPEMLVLKKFNVYSSHWNQDFSGYKIGVIADLHIGTYRVDLPKLKKVVRTINNQKPDLIVLLGDLDAKAITEKKYSQDELAEILSDLKAKDGVIAILGNHDFEPKNVVRNILNKANIPILENQEKYITHNGQKIRVIGLKDWWHNKYNPEDFIKNNNCPTIVLSHNPDVFPKIPYFVAATISGHTHGGEIILPFFGSPFVPSDYGQRYNKGRIIENGKFLIVSGGVASLSRLRFCNPPELAIVTVIYDKDKIVKDSKVQRGFSKNYAGPCLNFVKKVYKVLHI